MKYLFLSLLLTCSVNLCFGQKGLLSYNDLRFILHQNLQQADTFLMIKGYRVTKKNDNTKNRHYTLAANGDTYTNINIRLDGKKLYVEIETNEISQYDLIHNSISPYIDKNTTGPGVETYVIKDLGIIYISVDDPYGNPLKRIIIYTL